MSLDVRTNPLSALMHTTTMLTVAIPPRFYLPRTVIKKTDLTLTEKNESEDDEAMVTAIDKNELLASALFLQPQIPRALALRDAGGGPAGVRTWVPQSSGVCELTWNQRRRTTVAKIHQMGQVFSRKTSMISTSCNLARKFYQYVDCITRQSKFDKLREYR